MNSNGTNDSTKDLTEDLSDRQLLLLLLERETSDRELLQLLLEHVKGIDARVIRLETADEDRKRETRPLWERLEVQVTFIMSRLSAIEEEQEGMREEQRRMRAEISLFREDLRNERRERSYLDERVSVLERPHA